MSGKSASFFQRNLIVTDRDLVPNKDDDFGEVSLTLRNRDFRYATLDRSDLHRVDFTGSDLTGASMVGVNLLSARLSCPRTEEEDTDVFEESRPEGCTKLVFTDMKKARLSGADLQLADMRGVRLEEAEIQGVKLQQADLQGANLSYAKAQGANLSLAKLSGAELAWSNFDGANLSVAELQGANLQSSDLQGANLAFTRAYGAKFNFAKLHGAVLRNAKLQGADLSDALIPVADMRQAQLWQTTAPRKERTELADLRDAVIAPLEAGQIDELRKLVVGLDDTVRSSVKESVEALVSSREGNIWQDDADKQFWTALVAESKQRTGEKFRVEVSEALSELACEDKSSGAFLAGGLVTRAIYQFNGDLRFFREGVTNADCAIHKKLAPDLLEKLLNADGE